MPLRVYALREQGFRFFRVANTTWLRFRVLLGEGTREESFERVPIGSTSCDI
jgi:hypothetical protein